MGLKVMPLNFFTKKNSNTISLKNSIYYILRHNLSVLFFNELIEYYFMV